LVEGWYREGCGEIGNTHFMLGTGYAI